VYLIKNSGNMQIMKHYLTVILTTALYINAIVTVAIAQTPNLAQTSTNSPENVNVSEGQKLVQEGFELYKKGTLEAKKQGLNKFNIALQIWQKLGLKEQQAITLQSLGLGYYLLGDPRKCLESYQQSLAIYQQLKDGKSAGILLISIAGVQRDLGEKESALKSYERSLEILEKFPNSGLKAQILSSIGTLYLDLGQSVKAVDILNQALEIEKKDKNQKSSALILQTLGRIYANLGENVNAINVLNQALSIFKIDNDAVNQGITLIQLGVIYFSTGEEQKALNNYNQALSLFQNKNNEVWQAIAFSSIAGIYKAKGDEKKAIDYYQRALGIQTRLGNPYLLAEIFNDLGLLYTELGDQEQSLKYYSQALSLHKQNQNSERVAFTLSSIGSIYNVIGENQKALDNYQQAISLQRQIKDKNGEATTLTYMAGLYGNLGNYQLSLDTYNQALQLFEETGDRLREAHTLDNISSIYKTLGDYEQSLTFNHRALTIAQKYKNTFQEIAIMTTLVRVYEEQKDYKNALQTAENVVKLGEQINNKFLIATGLIQMGRSYRLLGKNQQALEVTQKAIPLFKEIKKPGGSAPALDNLGRIYQALNQVETAVKVYQQALDLKTKIGDNTGAAETLFNLAILERDSGNLNIALTHIEASLKIIESLRTKVASEDLRISYFASVQKYYQLYIDLLMKLHQEQPKSGYNTKALLASEKAKARSLVDLLTEAKMEFTTGMDKNLLSEMKQLEQKIKKTEEKRIRMLNTDYQDTELTAIKQEMNNLLTQYDQMSGKMRISNPKYANLMQPKTLNLTEIQNKILDDNTLILEYALGAEKSYLWVISKQNVSSYELPKQEEIETAASRFRAQLTSPLVAEKDIINASTALSQMILAPVADKIGNKKLLIVGDGALQYIPFSALNLPQKPEQPLLVSNEIVNLPSISTLAILREQNQGKKAALKTLAVIADPVFTGNDERLKSKINRQKSMPIELARAANDTDIDFNRLPGTRKEATEILALVPEDQRKQSFDFAANINNAKSPELGEYKILHFATHGILNSQHPDLSGLVLSLVDENDQPQNGFLRLHDIYNMNLSAELVVLSACKTGLGKEIRGEGLIGLTRGFMYAGSSKVVVSLWSVDDVATAELMIKFYQKMLQQGLKPAAALRSAQLELWQNKQWKAPYYWGAFILQGDG
jgi:CHAT domain-containing protein/Tfp pilus assembly protein PilF